MDIKTDILPLKNTLYRLALRITQNSQEAEDVVQDVIIKLWNMRERLDEVENLEAFALKMTRNLSLDRERMRINQTEDIEGKEFSLAAPSIELQLEQQEKIDIIRRIMEQLPEKLRTAMHLRDFEGLSYQEIAQTMGITEDQVKVCIFRARQAVKAKVNA